jgi:hypothetical protein
MKAAGIEYGKVYTAEFFEERLMVKRDDPSFCFDIPRIRRELEHSGYYLSGRGGKGETYVILPPENNADQMLAYQSAAMDALKRGCILGTNTRLDTLSAEDRRRHEAVLERAMTRSLLINRPMQVKALLEKKKPGLLQKPKRPKKK